MSGKAGKNKTAHKVKSMKDEHHKGTRQDSHKASHRAKGINEHQTKHKTHTRATTHHHAITHHNITTHHYAKKFCPKCGKSISHEDTFCRKCRQIDFDFKDIKILLCNNCGSYNHKNKWQRYNDLDMPVKIAVSDSVKHNVRYQDMDENTVEELSSYKAGVHKGFTVKVAIRKEIYELPAIVDVTLCPKCSKQGTKYFEGVLQIRNADKDIIEFIKNDLSRQRSKGIHINKEVDIDGSGTDIDYYYTDKRYIKVIAEKLRKSFGATIKHNAQLFSIDWETSKNVYRLNVLVEFPNYQKNDVIKIGKQLFRIMSMDEKVHVTNLETGTKTLIPHKESYDVLKPVEVMLIKKYPEYEILDPNTYYQARLMNPSESLQINQKLHVIIDGGEAWMVKE